MLTPTDIRAEVLIILQKADTWLSVYQILERLSVRDTLILERGMPGTGSGSSYTASTVVSQAVQMLSTEPGYQQPIYMSGRRVWFEVQGTMVQPGYDSCALYRITTPVP